MRSARAVPRPPTLAASAWLLSATLLGACAPPGDPSGDGAPLDARDAHSEELVTNPGLDAEALDAAGSDAGASFDARPRSDAAPPLDARPPGVDARPPGSDAAPADARPPSGDAGAVPPALPCTGSTCATLCAMAERGPADYSRENSGAAVPGASAEQSEALRRVNRFRTAAGLPAFAGHAQVQQAAQAHAAYAARNTSAMCRPLGSVHYEDASCPGFTGMTPYDRMSAAGYRAITPSGEVMAPSSASATAAVDAWLWSVYHRFGMFRPQLVHAGFGVEGSMRVMLFARTTYENVTSAPLTVFPVPGQSDVPPGFSGNESPRPPLPGDGSFPSGTVVSVQGLAIDFTDTPMHITEHALLDASCQPVAHVAFDERVDSRIRDEGVVYLYANQPLAAGQRYTAHLAGTLGGVPWRRTWSFTTR